MSVYEKSGPLGMDQVPTWAWAAATCLLTAMLALAATVVYSVIWQLDRAAVEEHRALFMAQSISKVAADHDEATTQRFIDAVAKARGQTMTEAFVITSGTPDRYGINRGQRYGAILETELRGKPIAPLATADPSAVPQAPRHKLRFDRFNRVITGLEAKARPQRAAPWIEMKQDTVGQQTWFAVQVPVKTTGAAGATFSQIAPSNPTPWWLLLILTLLLSAAAAAIFIGGGGKLDTKARIGAFVALALVSAVGFQVATSFHYAGQLQPLVQERLADAAAAFEAAKAAGLDAKTAADIVHAADIDFTGATGLLLDKTDPAAASERLSLLVSQRDNTASMLLWLAMLLLAGGVAAGVKPLLRGVVACYENPYAYLYVMPSLLGMVVLVFVPFSIGVGLSFFAYDAPRYYFHGLGNFSEILLGSESGEVTFYWTLFATILWTVCNVILHVGIGLGLALLLKDPMLRFKNVYRVLLIIPWAIPNYITALIWKGMFNKEFGAVNQFIEAAQSALGMTPDGVDWLGGSFATAFTANLVTNTWLGFPFMMVVALGALQSIPGALYEAAEVDGAGPWDKFRHITLPLLKPALFPAIILGSIWTFNMFNVIYLVSGGGPENSTEILITDAYRAFAELNRYGLAAAYSVIIFVILLLYTLITNRITKATEGAFE